MGPSLGKHLSWVLLARHLVFSLCSAPDPPPSSLAAFQVLLVDPRGGSALVAYSAFNHDALGVKVGGGLLGATGGTLRLGIRASMWML